MCLFCLVNFLKLNLYKKNLIEGRRVYKREMNEERERRLERVIRIKGLGRMFIVERLGVG